MDKKQVILDGGTNEEINDELREFFRWNKDGNKKPNETKNES